MKIVECAAQSRREWAPDARAESPRRLKCEDAAAMNPPARYRDLLVERLRALVDECGTSVMWVEKRIGRGRGYVSDALRGHKKLTVEVILDTLSVLGVPPEEFFAGSPSRRRAIVDASPGEGSSARKSSVRARGTSPLVQAVLLLLAQNGVSDAELREIERAIDARLRGHSSPRRSAAPKR